MYSWNLTRYIVLILIAGAVLTAALSIDAWSIFLFFGLVIWPFS